MEAKERILAGASELFMRYGCRSVTMDDIARHLTVSKKTLYQFYKDKDEIITTFAQNEFECEKGCMKDIVEGAENAVDEIMRISRHIREMSTKMNPSLLYDLQKYHTRAWQVFSDFKHSIIAENIRNNMIRGIREGLYRDDIDVEILTRLRVEMLQVAFDTKVFPPVRFGLLDIQMQIIELFIRGIATSKGLEVLHHYKTKYNSLQPS